MSAAINLTEGEEFLWPSVDFWSGAEAVRGKTSWRIFTVYSTVSDYTTVWFSALIRDSPTHIMDAFWLWRTAVFEVQLKGQVILQKQIVACYFYLKFFKKCVTGDLWCTNQAFLSQLGWAY